MKIKTILPSTNEVKKFYDDWATTYDFPYPFGEYEYGYEYFIVKMIRKVKIKNKLVLDIGCGAGFPSEDLLKLNNRVVSIDISKKLLKLARKKLDCNDISFIIGDVNHLPFKKNTFNAVLMVGWILNHTENYKKILKSIREILTLEGKLIFDVGNKYNIYLLRFKNKPIITTSLYDVNYYIENTYHPNIGIKKRKILELFFNPIGMKFLLKKIGFKVESVSGICFLTSRNFLGKVGWLTYPNSVEQFLVLVDNFFSFYPFKYLCENIILVCEK